MQITINGNPVNPDSIPGENLEEVLAEIQEKHIPRDSIVGDVLLNGSSYSEDLPHASLEVLRSEIRTLEIVTRSAEEIVRHFIAHGPAIVSSLLESLPRIVEMFRLGDEAEANEHFLRFLESLHLMVNMLQKVATFVETGPDQSRGDRESLNERMRSLADILTRLLETQEQSDWIYLADLLEYELTPELSAIRDLVPRIDRKLH